MVVTQKVEAEDKEVDLQEWRGQVRADSRQGEKKG